jgi:hypothetical protein
MFATPTPQTQETFNKSLKLKGLKVTIEIDEIESSDVDTIEPLLPPCLKHDVLANVLSKFNEFRGTRPQPNPQPNNLHE